MQLPYDRVVEIWYEGEEEWYKSAVEGTKDLPKPEWAQQDNFPFMKPQFNFTSMFLGDMATMDCYSQYHGYITMG